VFLEKDAFVRRFTAACFIAALTACGGGSPAPAGWQQLSGSTTTWVNGSAAERQSYTFTKEAFRGTLQDLARREVVDAALSGRGLKFVKSDVFGPCPGVAAIATFTGRGQTVEDGFAVAGGNALVVRYERPATVPDDPAAVAAMQRAICVAPG